MDMMKHSIIWDLLKTAEVSCFFLKWENFSHASWTILHFCSDFFFFFKEIVLHLEKNILN